MRIDTERLIIRDYVETDIKDFHNLFTDPVVMKLTPELKSQSRDESLKYLYEAILESKQVRRSKYFFAICLKETGEYVGEIGFTTLLDSYEGKLMNLGYLISPKFWGSGYVVEAAKALVDYGFKNLNVIKVEAGCVSANVQSLRVMEKLGMTQESYLVKHMLIDGKFEDRVDYRILKEEWEI